MNKQAKKLKDICKIGVGLTTLSDKSYIFHNLIEVPEIHSFKGLSKIKTDFKGEILIEKDILKPIIKGSTCKGDDGHSKE